jgi:hypothetical protein
MTTKKPPTKRRCQSSREALDRARRAVALSRGAAHCKEFSHLLPARCTAISLRHTGHWPQRRCPISKSCLSQDSIAAVKATAVAVTAAAAPEPPITHSMRLHTSEEVCAADGKLHARAALYCFFWRVWTGRRRARSTTWRSKVGDICCPYCLRRPDCMSPAWVWASKCP